MTLHSLLIPLDNDASISLRVRAAAMLAQRFDCRLVGVAATGLVDLPRGAENAEPLAKYAALTRDRLRDGAELAAHAFRSACTAAGVANYQVSIEEEDAVKSVQHHGHFHDLTVVRQGSTAAPRRAPSPNDVDHLVLANPHATLVLPIGATIDSIATRVLVAWDGSREATRAMTDALPLLCAASRVDVVAWMEPGASDELLLDRRLQLLRQWLAERRVPAEVHLESTSSSIAVAMLARATEAKADLLVMGAYGHTRLVERVLGGATQGVLSAMTLPVLLSH